MPVAVVTDSTNYLPPVTRDQAGLREVSLYVHWNGRQERESDITDLDAFYDQLRNASALPKTSQPSVGDFLAVYEPLLEGGSDVVSIHLAAGLSGTCESAEQARARLVERGVAPERITVIDSATACGGLGIVVLAAARAARAGANAEAVAERAREARRALKMWFSIDTLEYLRRGGRIGGAQAWLGSALKIKPILTVESEITPIERVRTSRRAFERMLDYMRMRHDDGADGWVVQHIQARETAERLIEAGRELWGTDPAFTSEIGPVIGAHVGPGLIGIGGVPRWLMEEQPPS